MEAVIKRLHPYELASNTDYLFFMNPTKDE